MVSNEQLSSLFDANLAALVGDTQAANVTALLQDEAFAESNLMHSINGACTTILRMSLDCLHVLPQCGTTT